MSKAKKPTAKQLKTQIADLRAHLRATHAYDRFGSLFEDRRWQHNLLLELEADLGAREDAARERAFKARQVAWNNRYATR